MGQTDPHTRKSQDDYNEIIPLVGTCRLQCQK